MAINAGSIGNVFIRATRPPQTWLVPRDPTPYDTQGYALLDEWLNTVNDKAWVLVSLKGNSQSRGEVALWINFANNGSLASSFIADDGKTAIPQNGQLYITGQTPLSTSVPVDGEDVFQVGFSPATNGQLIIGATGANPAWANLTSVGMTVTITNTPNGINLEAAGGGATTVTAVGDTGFAVTLAGSFNIVGGTNIATSGDNAQTLTINNTGNASLTWTDITGTSQVMAINKGYTANNAGLVTLTLPSTAAYGSIFYVVGKGAGGWKIAQNSGQTIHFGSVNTTTGTGGYLASTLQYDVVAFICSVANTDFTVIQSVGDITYV